MGTVNIPPGSDLNGDPHHNQLEAALIKIADFRFNLISRFPELKFKAPNAKWKRLDDYTLNSIVRDLKNKGIRRVSKTIIGELLESDFSPKINPVRQYFETLHFKGGDPIKDLAATVKPVFGRYSAEQMSKAFRVFLTKWLVGAVANVFIEDRCANQICFILAGRQGAFKSTWIRNLCPPALSDYYIEGSLDPDNKDSLLETATNFMFNLDDYFAAINSKKINEFKGLLTKNTVKVRRPYARYTEELPKISSFIASSNEQQFLHDPTGNRRFVPFEINQIDIKAAQAVDINQVWAQAYQLFRKDFRYWLNKEDQAFLAKRNEEFEVQSQEFEVLTSYLRPPAPNEIPDATLTNAEIIQYLNNKVQAKLNPKRLEQPFGRLISHGNKNVVETPEPGSIKSFTLMKQILLLDGNPIKSKSCRVLVVTLVTNIKICDFQYFSCHN